MSRRATGTAALLALLFSCALCLPALADAAAKEKESKPAAAKATHPAAAAKTAKTHKAKEASKSGAQTGGTRQSVRTLLERSPAYSSIPEKGK